MVLVLALSLVACGGGKCDGCGSKTNNKLTIEGETGYICDKCCQETFGMSFDQVKGMMEMAN